MSENSPGFEMNEFEQGERDYYISNDWAEVRPDPVKGVRYG
jgi:hypothetical protein